MTPTAEADNQSPTGPPLFVDVRALAVERARTLEDQAFSRTVMTALVWGVTSRAMRSDKTKNGDEANNLIDYSTLNSDSSAPILMPRLQRARMTQSRVSSQAKRSISRRWEHRVLPDAKHRSISPKSTRPSEQFMLPRSSCPPPTSRIHHHQGRTRRRAEPLASMLPRPRQSGSQNWQRCTHAETTRTQPQEQSRQVLLSTLLRASRQLRLALDHRSRSRARRRRSRARICSRAQICSA